MYVTQKRLATIGTGIGSLLSLIAFFFLPFAQDFLFAESVFRKNLNYPFPITAAEFAASPYIPSVYKYILWLQPLCALLVLGLSIGFCFNLFRCSEQSKNAYSTIITRLFAVCIPVLGLLALATIFSFSLYHDYIFEDMGNLFTAYRQGFWLISFGMLIITLGGLIGLPFLSDTKLLHLFTLKSVGPFFAGIGGCLALYAFTIPLYVDMFFTVYHSEPAGEQYLFPFSGISYLSGIFSAHLYWRPQNLVVYYSDLFLLWLQPLFALIIVVFAGHLWLEASREKADLYTNQPSQARPRLIKPVTLLILSVLMLVDLALLRPLSFKILNVDGSTVDASVDAFIHYYTGFWLFAIAMGLSGIGGLLHIFFLHRQVHAPSSLALLLAIEKNGQEANGIKNT